MKNRITAISTVFFLCFLPFLSEGKSHTPVYRYYGSKKCNPRIITKIASLYEMTVSNADRAQHEIDSLKYVVEKLDNNELIIDLLLLEAEVYRSKGDFVHMKLSYYQGISWKDEKTERYYGLFLNYFAALNEGIKGNPQKEKAMLEAVLAKSVKGKYLFLEASANRALGKLNTKLENCTQAGKHYKRAQHLFRNMGYEVIAFDLQISLGITEYWDKQYDKALKCFHEAHAFAIAKNLPKCQANALISLAEVHLFIPASIDSSAYYLKQFEQIRSQADIRDILNYYWTKEHYFKEIGNADSAYWYLNKQVELDDKISLKMNQATANEIDVVFKKLQNERKLRRERNTQKNFKLVFGFIGLLLLGSLFVLWLIIKEKSRYNFVLMAQKDEILHKKKQIDQALKEKEILLKEIHHRVKNNLQIISSLLSLQSKNIEDESAKQAILEGKERIQAIALIHHKLYLDETFARIDMGEYLGDLVAQLGRSYNDKLQYINLSLNTNGIILNLDTVVPLGLIISELTTNAFKYAFVGMEEGKLKIVIQQTADGMYELLVKDNGIGMLDDFDFLNSQTLGMEIVSALTDQLEGEISYKSGQQGTSIRIKFKEVNNS